MTPDDPYRPASLGDLQDTINRGRNNRARPMSREALDWTTRATAQAAEAPAAPPRDVRNSLAGGRPVSVLARLRPPRLAGTARMVGGRALPMVGAGMAFGDVARDVSERGAGALDAPNVMQALGGTMMAAAPFMSAGSLPMGLGGMALSGVGSMMRGAPSAPAETTRLDWDGNPVPFTGRAADGVKSMRPMSASLGDAPGRPSLAEDAQAAIEGGAESNPNSAAPVVPSAQISVPQMPAAMPKSAPAKMAWGKPVEQVPADPMAALRQTLVQNEESAPSAEMVNPMGMVDLDQIQQLAAATGTADDPFAALAALRAAIVPALAGAAYNKAAVQQAKLDQDANAQALTARKQGADEAIALAKFGEDRNALAARMEAERAALAQKLGVEQAELAARLGIAQAELDARLQAAVLSADKSQFDIKEVGGGTDDRGNVMPKSVAVVNKRTGDVRYDGPAGAQPAPQFETGRTYQDANGNLARWNGKEFEPL